MLDQHTIIQCTTIQEVSPDYIITRRIDGLLAGAPAWIPSKGYIGTATTTAGVYYRHDLALRRSMAPAQTPTPGRADYPVTTKTQKEAFGAKLPGAVEFATLPSRILKAKEELQEAEATAAALEARLAELGDPTAELTDAQKQFETKQTELQQLQSTETEQTENLAASTSQIAQLEAEVQTQQKEINQLKSELSDINARIATKKAEIAKLEANNPPFFGILMLIAGITIALLGFFTPFFNLLPR